MINGLFINLDKYVDRCLSLKNRLDRVGLMSSNYMRFSAVQPLGDEPQLQRGLKSKGELGAWQSFVAAFDFVSTGVFADVVHILEDDALFSADIKLAVSKFSAMMQPGSLLSGVDIIFLDYFMNRDLYSHVIERSAHIPRGSFELLPAHKAYLACCTSFLVRQSSAAYISEMLARVLDSSSTLYPVDITLRYLLQIGVIKGCLCVPIMGASSWEDDENSAIQPLVDVSIRRSQRAHLLLKLIASNLRTPFWCAKKLSEMFGVSNPLDELSDAVDFLIFFDSLGSRIIDF